MYAQLFEGTAQHCLGPVQPLQALERDHAALSVPFKAQKFVRSGVMHAGAEHFDWSLNRTHFSDDATSAFGVSKPLFDNGIARGRARVCCVMLPVRLSERSVCMHEYDYMCVTKTASLTALCAFARTPGSERVEL